jgi:hypothetical protein
MRTVLVLARTAVTMIALAHLSLAQAPRTPDVTPFFERSQDAPRSKSDAHRLVGTVLEVDRERGVVKLSTDEGDRVVKPEARLLGAVRVGDMVSVPRPAGEGGSASPRTR